jgi:O-antigen ligase
MGGRVTVFRNHAQPGAERFFLFAAALLLVLGSVFLLATPKPVLAIGPAGALAAMFLFWRHPQAAFYLIVFLIPFGSYRTIVAGYEALTISKFVGAWLVLVVVVTSIAEKNLPDRIRSNLWGILAVFFALNIVSALLSPYPAVAFNGVRRLVTDYAFFALTIFFASTPRRFSRTLPAVIMTGIGVSICVTFIGRAMGLEQFTHDIRSVGTSVNANMYALMLVFSLPIFAHFAFHAASRTGRLLATAFVPMTVLGVMLTYSRSSFLILLAVCALLFFEHAHRFRPRMAGLFLAVAGAAVLAAAIYAPQGFWTRQRTVTDKSDEAISRRISYLQFAPEAFMKRPVVGSGLETYKELYGQSKYAVAHTTGEEHKRRRYAHNAFVEILIGNGALGLMLFLALLYKGFSNFTAAARSFLKQGSPVMASLAGALRISYAAMLLSFFFSSGIHRKYWWILFGLSQAAVTLSLMRKGRADGKTAPVPAEAAP